MRILPKHRFGPYAAATVLTLTTALAFVAPPAMASAVSSVVSPDFICPTGDACFFSGNNENGNVIAYNTPLGGWYHIPQGYRGSGSNMSNYNVWTDNVSANNNLTCLASNRKGIIGQAGYWYVNGSGGCNTNPPNYPPQ